MKLYSSDDSYKLYQGNMLDLETCIKPSSIDSIVTDPPYELGFMGKGWDSSGVAFQKETWEHCLRVLKPGGYLLAFGGSRTFHRITCAIEDAGFEIRDVIMWLYGSGFPKSMNLGLAIDKRNGIESKIVGYEKSSMPDFRDVGKKQKEASGVDKLTFGQIENSERKQQPIFQAQNEWGGWGTALKPSYEPIIVARKPCVGSCIDNVLQYGVGGINIDECRVEPTNERLGRNNNVPTYGGVALHEAKTPGLDQSDKMDNGRFPANTILTYDETDRDDVCEGFPVTNDESAARYFYCAKASKRDRDEGLDKMNPQKCNDGRNTPIDNAFQRGETLRKNIHPTVKPTDLMQYLVRLVTPVGGVVLDPFNGSGSTGKAVMYENKYHNKNNKYIGIELTEEYLPISKSRIEYVLGVEEDKTGQMTILDFMGV